MVSIYQTDLATGRLVEVPAVARGCWVNLVSPTADEVATVCQEAHISSEFIDYALDREEKPRIDRDEDERTELILIDVPIETPGEAKGVASFDTIPLGIIIVRDEILITVSLESVQTVGIFASGRRHRFSTALKSRFVLQIFLESASNYLACLKTLNKERSRVEAELAATYKNQELLRLLDVQKSLVYFETSLKANEAVMERLQRGKTMPLYNDDDEILEDAIIENKQALEMTQIYSNVLKSTMEVYGSLISNNLSSIMRFLTSITIFLAIPTMFAGFWGMNVDIPFQENAWSFWAVLVGSMLLGVAVSVAVSWRKR